MVYNILWNPKAELDFTSLERDIQERIVIKIESILDNPQRYMDYLQKYHVFKLRVGDWRVFIDLRQNEHELEVLAIKHRSKAYKRL